MEQEEHDYQEGDPCPRCGLGKLRLRQTRRGSFWGCSNYPDCDFIVPVAVHQQVVIVRELELPCPQCGAPLAVKNGRYGLFIGCTNYPSCSYVSTKTEPETVSCPVCKVGKLAERVSKSGQVFYSCTNYPECRFILPGRPLTQSCPRCSFPLMFEKKTAKGVAILCGNSLCPSRRKHRRKVAAKRTLTEAEAQFLQRLDDLN